MQNISVNGYVLHGSHSSFVIFVSCNINERKYIFVCFYMDKFDKNNFRADEKRTSKPAFQMLYLSVFTLFYYKDRNA